MSVLWTEDHLLALPDTGFKAEVVEGRLRMAPAGGSLGNFGLRLGGLLEAYAFEHQLGAVFDSSTGFVLSPETMLSPDASFVTIERIRAMGGIPSGFIQGAPDLAVEILSPSDLAPDLLAKIKTYFSHGTKVIWIIDPKTRSAEVYRPNHDVIDIPESGELTAEDLLPGFSVRLKRVFATIPL